MAFFFVLFVLSSIGLPGTNGFVSEFLTILGAFTSPHLGPTFAAVAATGIILGALYMLHMTARVIWGPLKFPAPHSHDPLPRGAIAYDAHGGGHATRGQAAAADDAETGDLTGREIGILLPLALAAIVLGVMPTPMLDSILRPVQALRTPAGPVPQRPLAAAPAPLAPVPRGEGRGEGLSLIQSLDH
jgi:NADH-quinone oxidoreductase subunit M